MRKNSRPNARKFWLNLHLYIGLVVGLVFVLAGLTGSLLVFYIEIDELLNPELEVALPLNKTRSYEEIFQALKSRHPERENAWRLEVPSSQNRMLTARYYKPDETKHLLFAPLMVSVNPYTAEVVASRIWGDFVMTWIYNLHYQLLLDKTGKIILTVTGVFILFSIGSGLYLWWPSRGKIKSALTLKRKASKQRFVYDLHKLNGIYGLLVLLIVVGTGTLLELPPLKEIVGSMSKLYKPENTQSEFSKDARRIAVDDAVSIAMNRFPHANVKWIDTPKGLSGSYRINLRQPGEPGQRFPKTNVWVDQYNGQIVSIRDVEKDSTGDTFIRWLHPLHSGQAFGLFGRIIICISGLVPLILYITGFIRWRQKKRNKRYTKRTVSSTFYNNR